MVSNLAGCLTLCTIFFASSAVCQEGLLPIALAKSSTDNDPKSIASKIRWKVYKGASIKEAKILDVPVQDSQTLYDNIDSDKPVVFYMHGFRDSPKGENIRTIVAAYLERATDNIIVLDWSEIASENYITLAATRVRDVAKVLARSVDRLVQLGCDRKTIHLVGHSLGAQLVGFLGKFSKYSIPRITGLDPAYPGFYHLGAEHIDANSAELVDIIHTDGGVYGVASPTGTVDFFPNGGKRPQPGCSLLAVPSSDEDSCSHQRSWRYYAESVLNERAFPAYQCSFHSKYLLGKCASNRPVYMGYAAPTGAAGSFYLTTNDKPPYGQDSRAHTGNEVRT